MGVLEKRNKRANLQKLILMTVGVTGSIAIGLVAPNVLVAMKRLGLLPYTRQKEAIFSSQKRLIQKGFLEYDKKGVLKITQRGRKKLLIETYLDKTKERNRKWDKKWRVLIFDIPENRKNDREGLRHTLISIGFMKLQDSVWIYPYDCEDLITLLKVDMEIGKEIIYMIVEAIENDDLIKEHFCLH